MTNPKAEPNEQASQAVNNCDHHWVSHHNLGIHVSICSLCQKIDFVELLALIKDRGRRARAAEAKRVLRSHQRTLGHMFEINLKHRIKQLRIPHIRHFINPKPSKDSDK